MNIDDEILLLLLSGGHISISDSKELGIWPHPPILFNDLVSFLVRILEKQHYFPRQWEEYTEGDVIYEGLVLSKEGENTYKIRCRRHNPTNPKILAEESIDKITELTTIVKDRVASGSSEIQERFNENYRQFLISELEKLETSESSVNVEQKA